MHFNRSTMLLVVTLNFLLTGGCGAQPKESSTPPGQREELSVSEFNRTAEEFNEQVRYSIVSGKTYEVTRETVNGGLKKIERAGATPDQLAMLRFQLSRAISLGLDRVGMNQVTGRENEKDAQRIKQLLALQQELKGNTAEEITAFKQAGNAGLTVAIAAGDTVDVTFALLAGADPTFSKNGITPLHIAVLQNRANVVELLLAAGADVNVKGKAGVRPIHLAAMSADAKILRMLLDKGADIKVKNDDGDTPLTLAQKADNYENVALLKGSAK